MQSTKRFSLAGLGRMGRVHLAAALENSLEINILFDADNGLAESYDVPGASRDYAKGSTGWKHTRRLRKTFS